MSARKLITKFNHKRTIDALSGHGHGFVQTDLSGFQNLTGLSARRGLHGRNDDQRPLSILTATEIDRLLIRWNQTKVPLPKQPLIHRLFEEQAAKTPDKVAVRFGPKQLTYAELNQKANRLARHLHLLGVGPGVLVGIYLERSLEMMIGLMGVLKAGGGYVPLDPAFPLDRLAYMVEDAKVPLLLTQEALVPGIFEQNATLLCLDRLPCLDALPCLYTHGSQTETSFRGSNDNTNLGRDIEPEDLAYVIYTSGSTGRPKGVQIPHIAAVNFLLSMAARPGLDAADVLVAVTTLSFDIALLELFLPLTVGAQVVIASREEAADAGRLLALMTHADSTVLQATPATWRMLLDIGWQGTPNLRALCGGEAFPVDIAEKLLARCASVWNMYGPTETTVWSTIHEVKRVSSPIPIGQPIANTEIYILDERLQLVPIGVPGVLYIGGAGLAHGYLNRPELTDEKFIPHPFNPEPGARIYNTGDMAKYLPDGTIECLGRIDHQVKIRGFRIELGEIEALLNDHNLVRQNVVIAREDVPENKILVAYLVVNKIQPDGVQSSASQPSLSTRELRAYLKKNLPDYMIPAAFVFVDEIPLTPNAKVNRLALPAPDMNRDSAHEDFVAPRDSIEATIASIWEEHVNVRPIGVGDDFFELGGTSLVAVRVFAQIEQTLGKKLPLATLFDVSTVAGLADVIRNNAHSQQGVALVKIKQGTDLERPPLFLCHGAGGAVLLYRALAQHLAPEQTVYGIQAIGLDERVEPHTQIDEMADYYLKEIVRVQPEGPYLLGGYCMGGSIVLELAQRLRQDGKAVGLLALLETYNWINGGRMGLKDKLIHTVEKIDFHLRNLLLSDAEGKRLFFREKFEELVRRLKMFKSAPVNSTGTVESAGSGHSPGVDDHAFATTSRVWEINDAASLIYQPSPYPGRITHIITRKQYSCYAAPEMAWDDLAQDGVDTVTLNAYPAGMLNEPFVIELAEVIQDRIDHALMDLHEQRLGIGYRASFRPDLVIKRLDIM